MTQFSRTTPTLARARGGRILLAALTAVGLLIGLTLPQAAMAKPAGKAPVQLRVKLDKSVYDVGQRPVVKIKAKTRRHGKRVNAKGKVVVKALGERTVAKVRRGKARVRLPELTSAGTFKVRVTFKGKGLRTRKVTKRFTVQAAEWNVPDAALREEIRDALNLPDGHALTLDDAAALNNANGAALWFGDVGTAAGLEVATNLTVLNDYTAGNAQDSRGLDNIVRVNGDFWISNAVQDASYPRLAYVGGAIQAFNISTERIRTISMPALVDAKSVRIEERPQLAGISFPQLTTVRGDVDIDSNPALTAVDLPALVSVHGDLLLDDLDVATAVRLPSLADVVSLSVTDVPRAQVLDLSRLTRVNGRLQVSGLPLLGGLAAPALTQVAEDVTLYGLGSIAELKMPALQLSHGRVSFGMGEDFPALPRDGSAVSFPAFDVTQAVDFDFSVRGLTNSPGSTKELRWQEFLAHFGVA